jgi:hypothetical protein
MKTNRVWIWYNTNTIYFVSKGEKGTSAATNSAQVKYVNDIPNSSRPGHCRSVIEKQLYFIRFAKFT